MSLFDYEASKRIAAQDYPFYALVMALYRQADSFNQARIERAWPQVAAELKARYAAPGGELPGDRGHTEKV